MSLIPSLECVIPSLTITTHLSIDAVRVILCGDFSPELATAPLEMVNYIDNPRIFGSLVIFSPVSSDILTHVIIN